VSVSQYLPHPYFHVKHDFTILSQSAQSNDVFPHADNFLELVDSGSESKALSILSEFNRMAACELTMRTLYSPYALMDVSIHWHGGEGHVLCIEKDTHLTELENLVSQHRARLAETNMELLDKKEALEQALIEVKKLSSPLIEITKKEALVPLFGDLDSALIEHNETPLLAKIFEEEYDVIHFDFSGVGEISEEGVSKFINLLQKLDLMGVVPSVVAIKPNHAIYLNKSSIKMKIEFQNSLSKVLKKSNCVT
jgi:rsbT co-antagonist protein RsbR